MKWLQPASLLVVDKLKLTKRLAKPAAFIHGKMVMLYSAKEAGAKTKLYLADILSYMLVVFIIITVFSLLSGSKAIVVLGGAVLLLLPVLKIRELNQRLEHKKRDILLELPLLLNQLVLLVNAGEQVQQALIRCMQQKHRGSSDSLYKELERVIRQLQNNVSFQQALEDFNRRCGIQEVSIFVNTILMNYRRGGDEFVASLRLLSHQLWESRKSTARRMGEEASSKLVFPMVILFLVVMVITGAPAVMYMN